MNFEKVILASCLLFACHTATPAPVAPTEKPAAAKPQGTVIVKPLGCTVYPPEEAFFERWFEPGNAESFSEQVCGGAKVDEDQTCFELFAKGFISLAVQRYENGDREAAANAFTKCADENPNLECFRVFENTLIETNNQMCSSSK